MSQEEKIKFLIKTILEELHIELKDIYIFGSRARGDFCNQSDYDIFVVIKELNEGCTKKQIWWLLYSKIHKDFTDTPFDIIVKTEKEFENRKKIANTISNEVLVEGIKL